MCVLPLPQRGAPPHLDRANVQKRGSRGGRVSVLPILPLSCHPLPHTPRIPSGKLATKKHPQTQIRNVGQRDQDPESCGHPETGVPQPAPTKQRTLASRHPDL